MEKIYGIVLKKHLHSPKHWVIAELFGKVELFFKAPRTTLARLLPGSLISFSITKKQALEYADNIELIAPPSTNSVEKCAWLHHILELYDHFTVPEVDASLFNSMQEHLSALSYEQLDTTVFSSIHMLYVSNFLVNTGFYHSPALYFYQKCFKFITLQNNQGTFSTSALETLEYIRDNELLKLQKVITQCLKKHPNFLQFNTVPFVYAH